jgi:aryl-alcohol dehydrogenase-like predicted oxidoreductase
LRTIRFGRTNVQVPAISLGTWSYGGPQKSDGISVGWSGNDDEKARAALAAAWRAGITHWDTADAYGDGHAEELIGRMWAEVPREEIFLATKFGWVKGPHDHYYDPKFMRAQCERSLRLLRVDVIDLYYFHHCDFGPRQESFDDALAVMRALRDEGKIRFIGLSDWDARKIMRFIERVDPDVVQPYRNLVDDDYESSGLKQYVDEHDLGVAFFSPLKHGLLLGKYEKPPVFPEGDFRSRIAGFRDAGFIARMKDARAKVSDRFHDRQEPVLHALTGGLLGGNPTATVLLGMRNPEQVRAGAVLGDEVSAAEAEWLRQIYRGA